MKKTTNCQYVELGNILELSSKIKVGKNICPIMSITMHKGLIDQSEKFKKRIASNNIENYKLVKRNDLVVGFPIDEGVLGFQTKYDTAAVSPAYDIWTLKNPQTVYLDYLEMVLRSDYARKIYKLKMQGTVSRRRSLPKEVFKKIKIPLPSMDIQQEIVSILEEIDDLRQKQRKAIELTRQMIPALFYEMFGKIDNPIYKLAPLAEAVLISRKKTNPQNQLTSIFHYIGLENIESKTGKIIGSTQCQGSEIKSLKSQFELGDILYGKLRPYLNKVCLPRNHGICSTDIFVLKPKNLICTPEFLCASLQTTYFVEQASAQMQGANLPRISAESLLQIPIILPPFTQQQQFTLKFIEIHSLIAQQEESLQKLDMLFETNLAKI